MRKAKTKKRKSLFMSKAKFNSLSAAAKRVHIAKDVIAQLERKKLKAYSGDFLDTMTIRDSNHDGYKEFMQDPHTDPCECCTKGAMFLSLCGINNGFALSDSKTHSVDLKSDAMKALAKVFSKQQLSLIETAFERNIYSWNEYDKKETWKKAVNFGYEYINDNSRLIAICENIIKNK